MVKIKPGVRFDVIAPAGYMILAAIKAAEKLLDFDLTITSGTDGTHSGVTDPHLLGEAYDIRTHDFLPVVKRNVLTAIMANLDPMRFYGFIEAVGEDAEHIHLQRRKGTTFTVEDFLNG